LRYYQFEKFDDISGLCCYDALTGKSAPCEGCQVPAAVNSRKSGSFERVGMMDSNNLEQVTLYHFDEKNHLFGGTLMHILDITKTRLMERKMIHNEKLASLGLMVSCITHEITNPMSAITFNAPILKDYTKAMISIIDEYVEDIQDFQLFQMPYLKFREDAVKIITNILYASQRIQNTVSDLRKLYGDKKRQVKRWSDLNQVIERVIAVVGVEINQRVESFEVNIPENLPKIYTDTDSIEQILTNLLINAAQAADTEDSRVKIDLILGNSWEDHLIIEVSDNGYGMDQETLSKIFNPFFSTKPPGQGTGLGLYVCQDLIKDLDGRIEVQSEAGKGSVFRVVLSDADRRSARRI
jgi:signal transduction histidine kinase